MMRRIFLLAALLPALLFVSDPPLFADPSIADPSIAADAPSAQVETVALKRQAIAATLSGYGVVTPDAGARETLSLPRAGRIVRLPVSAGQVVNKGEVLLVFATAADASLAYRQARQARDFARGELARTEQLANQQLATQSQLAAARKALAAAEAALRAQQKIGAGRASERLRAPFAGVVASVQATQGERLAAGAPLMSLAMSGKSRVLVGIEPDQVARLHPGMAVEVAPVFAPQAKLAGRVTQVFGVIDPQTQFVDVLVALQGGAPMPGTQVRAEIEVARQTAWVVPRSAVLKDARGAYLFQVAADHARRVNVKTGLTQGGLIAVHGDFDPKLPVVSLGNYELEDGMAVRGSGR